MAWVFPGGILSKSTVLGQDSKATSVRLAEPVSGIEAGSGLEMESGGGIDVSEDERVVLSQAELEELIDSRIAERERIKKEKEEAEKAATAGKPDLGMTSWGSGACITFSYTGCGADGFVGGLECSSRN